MDAQVAETIYYDLSGIAHHLLQNYSMQSEIAILKPP